MTSNERARFIAALVMTSIVWQSSAGCAFAGQESGQPTARTRPRVVLALGGGGIRGAAHIGVLRVLKREGIPIDAICGISMGAVIGGLYCAGVPLEKIESELA